MIELLYYCCNIKSFGKPKCEIDWARTAVIKLIKLLSNLLNSLQMITLMLMQNLLLPACTNILYRKKAMDKKYLFIKEVSLKAVIPHYLVYNWLYKIGMNSISLFIIRHLFEWLESPRISVLYLRVSTK